MRTRMPYLNSNGNNALFLNYTDFGIDRQHEYIVKLYYISTKKRGI